MSKVNAPLREDSSSDDETSSVLTAWTSSSEEREHYHVDCILAERGTTSAKEYLLKWAGYPEDRSTWEPTANIIDHRILLAWETRRALTSKGWRDPFDVQAWEHNQAEILEKKRRRYEKRKIKRRENGLPRVHPAEAESSSEDEPLFINAAAGRRTKAKTEADSAVTGVLGSDSDALVEATASSTRRQPSNPNLKGAGKAWNKPLPSKSESAVTRNEVETNARCGTLPSHTCEQDPPLPVAATSSMTARKTKLGLQVMRNWKALIPPRKKRKRAENKGLHMYNMSARWEAEKAGRNGIAPSTDKLDLVEPVNVPRAKALPQQQPPARFVIDMPACNSTSSQPIEEVQSKDTPRILLTCLGWRNSNCPVGAQRCAFLHMDTDHIAPESLFCQFIDHVNGSQRPKFCDRKFVCKFWASGRCYKDIDECPAAHFYWTDNVASVPTGSTSFTTTSTSTSMSNVTEPIPTEIPSKNTTCWFWYRGKCSKPDNACWFAHTLLSHIAPPPVGKLRAFEVRDDSSYRPSFPAFSPARTLGSLPVVQEDISPADASFNHHQQRASQADDCPQITIHLPGVSFPIQAKLCCLSGAAKEAIMHDFGSVPHLIFDQMCIRDSVEKHMLPSAQTSLGVGDIVTTGSEAETQALADLVNTLIIHSTGVVIKMNSLLLILYPTQLIGSEWSFIDRTTSAPPGCILSVEVRSNPTKMSKLMVSADQQAPRNIEQLFARDFDVPKDMLFEWLGRPEKLSKNVFLMCGNDREAEMDVILRLFREMGATVWCSSVPGAWEAFVKKANDNSTGVVLLHPGIYMYGQIPHFADLLMSRYNIYQLGADGEDADENGIVPIACKRLYPLGQTVWITDDVLMNNPHSALDIVIHLKDRNKDKPRGLEQWRLYGRPGIREWLFELYNEHFKDEHTNGDRARFELWHHINELIPEEDRFNPEPPRYPPEAVVITAPPADMPDYFKLLEQCQDDANDYLFDTFCLDACVFAQYCRRWVIVHDRELPRWTNKETHIRLYTPEKYKEKFGVLPAQRN